MRNLKKTLAVVTAIAAMLAAVPAFAETSVIDTVGPITVTPANIDTAPQVTASVTGVAEGEMTFLILDDGTDVTNIGENDILYINQQSSADGTSFTGAINLERVAAWESGTALPAGEYPIRLGYKSSSTGEFTIASAKLKVASAGGGTTVTIIWGDVNNDKSVTVLDASAVLERAIGGATAFSIEGRDETLNINSPYRIKYDESNTYNIVWGDVTNDKSVTVLDASAVLERAIGGSTSFAIEGSEDTFVINQNYDLIIEE